MKKAGPREGTSFQKSPAEPGECDANALGA